MIQLLSLWFALLQRSWVFTHWSPALRHMMEVEVKRVTTVSTITEIDLFIPISQKDQHLDVRLCVCSRCDQRGEDEPSV